MPICAQGMRVLRKQPQHFNGIKYNKRLFNLILFTFIALLHIAYWYERWRHSQIHFCSPVFPSEKFLTKIRSALVQFYTSKVIMIAQCVTSC